MKAAFESSRRSKLAWALIATLTVALPTHVQAAETTKVQWLTEALLEQQLDQDTQATWDGKPLREALATLSHSQRMALVLDRQVDPGQPLTLSFPPQPLRKALKQVAATLHLEVCQVGPVVVFGPAETIKLLPTVAALRRRDAGALSAATGAAWLRSKPSRWEDLTTPRELLEHEAEEIGTKILGLESLPHDLWAAGDLPALPPADRLTLILAQFNLTFKIEDQGRAITLIPFPAKASYDETYRPSGLKAGLLEQLRGESPQAEIKTTGQGILVRGLWDDHLRVRKALETKKPPNNVGPRTQRIDKLSVQNKPLGPVLSAVAKQLGLEVKLDDEAIAAAGISMDQLISFEVKAATLDEALTALLSPAMLSYRRTGTTVEVFPAK